MASSGRQQRDSKRLANGNELWRRHERWIRTVVLARIGPCADVEDVVQAVAAALSQSENLPEHSDRIGPWLYRVAIRQCLMYRRQMGRRRKQKFKQTTAWETTEDGQAVNPLDWILNEERRHAVREALESLEALDRQLLLLKYTESWSYRQLADRLGVSEKSIEHKLQRARERLRARLVKRNLLEIS